jgi:low temperature requirement protein LtrA
VATDGANEPGEAIGGTFDRQQIGGEQSESQGTSRKGEIEGTSRKGEIEGTSREGESEETSREGEIEGTYDEEEQRVTALELFFDLVFVFTLTQLTALLAADLSWEAAAQVLLIFSVLWWMYAAYAWLTNQVPPDRDSRRITLLVGMAAFLVCALTIPRAFDGGGLAFGLGYLAVVIVHSALYAQALPLGTLVGFVPWNLTGALLIITAGMVDSADLGYALWVVAILLQVITPYLFRPNEQIDVHTAHFVERHGLLLIIAFGESIVAIGVGTGELELDVSFFGAALLGLALVAALWWTYFGGDEEGAQRALAAESVDRRGRLAIRAYYQAFAPMLLGIIAIAAGVKKALGHVQEELITGAALALAGGVALYLFGDVLFRYVLRLLPIGYRAATVLLALATIPLGVYVNGVAQLITLVVIIAALLAVEARTTP